MNNCKQCEETKMKFTSMVKQLRTCKLTLKNLAYNLPAKSKECELVRLTLQRLKDIKDGVAND